MNGESFRLSGFVVVVCLTVTPQHRSFGNRMGFWGVHCSISSGKDEGRRTVLSIQAAIFTNTSVVIRAHSVSGFRRAGCGA